MNVSLSISKGFDDYGNTLVILGKDSVTKTTGFIQPLSYRGSKYYGFDIEDISAKERIRYLCICKGNGEITKGDKIILDNTTYYVIRCEKFMSKDKCLYKWAILKLYYPKREDDFDDN